MKVILTLYDSDMYEFHLPQLNNTSPPHFSYHCVLGVSTNFAALSSIHKSLYQ